MSADAWAEVVEGHRDDGLVVRNDALHVEGVVEDLAEGVQRTGLQERRAGVEDQEAHDGLDGAGNDVLDRLALKRKTEEREKADEDCRRRQDVDKEVEYCLHLLYLTFKLGSTCIAICRGLSMPRRESQKAGCYSMGAVKKS